MKALALLLALAQADVRDLIRKLGEDSLEERERAVEALRSKGRAVLPELERAANSHSDAEVRARAREIIRHLTSVRWRTGVDGALRAAAAERKPLLVFSTIGPLDGYV